MPRAQVLALIAAGLTSACATSPQALPPPMPMEQRPTACLTPCQPLPIPTDDAETAIAIWMHDLIETAGQCRRMHETCRKAHD